MCARWKGLHMWNLKTNHSQLKEGNHLSLNHSSRDVIECVKASGAFPHLHHQMNPNPNPSLWRFYFWRRNTWLQHVCSLLLMHQILCSESSADVNDGEKQHQLFGFWNFSQKDLKPSNGFLHWEFVFYTVLRFDVLFGPVIGGCFSEARNQIVKVAALLNWPNRANEQHRWFKTSQCCPKSRKQGGNLMQVLFRVGIKEKIFVCLCVTFRLNVLWLCNDDDGGVLEDIILCLQQRTNFQSKSFQNCFPEWTKMKNG